MAGVCGHRIAMGRDLDFSGDPKKQKKFQELDFDKMHRECCETEAACLRLDSPVVLSHNDMLAGNVLVPHNVSLQSLASICKWCLRHANHWAGKATHS